MCEFKSILFIKELSEYPNIIDIIENVLGKQNLFGDLLLKLYFFYSFGELASSSFSPS